MNKIKTTKTIILAALLVIGSLFTSCSSDDSSGENDENKEVSIVGEWRTASSVKEIFLDNVSQGKEPRTIDDKNYQIFTFKADGTFIDFEEDEEGAHTDLGTYRLDGDILVISYGEDDDIESFGFSLSQNELIIVLTDGEDPASKIKHVYTDTFKRQ